MKILQVSFKNLNSLRGEHRIDLAAGPLSQAGIFAITGPTGAGKSTILDAITLALYGRAARYGSTPSPEHMMSRHTGECQAEVVFAVNRGEFRASWHLKRARGKADGNLQPPQRRVFDAAGVTLAQKVGDADRLVEELTGLDYDRFLRSVLLAQGDFARFLKASADERAGLLEQLTGTDIYSRLSILAHTETGRRETALEQEEEASAAIIILSEEERAVKTAEIARLTAEVAVGSREHDALAERVNLGRQLRARLEEADHLAARRQELAARREHAAADFARLDRHDRTQPFCAGLARLDASAVRVAESEKLLAEAQAAAQAAASALANGRAAVRLLAVAEVAAREGELTRRRDAEAKAAVELAALQQWLETHAGERALETQLPAISEKLALLTEARRRQEKLRARDGVLRARESNERREAEQTQARLAQAAATLADRAGKQATVAGELSALLGGRTPADFQADLGRLHDHRAVLGRLTALLERGDEAKAREKSLAATEETLARDLDGHLGQATQAQRTAALLASLVESLAEQLAGAQLIASFAEHRARLRAGEACPLCGSAEHPFATTEDETSSLDALTRKLAASKAELRTAERERRAREETLTRVTEQHKAAAEQRAAARREHELAWAEFGAQTTQRGITFAGPAEFSAQIAAAGSDLQRAEARIASLAQLQKRLDDATRAHNEAAVQTATLEETLRAARGALALTNGEVSAHAAEMSAHAAALAVLTSEAGRLLEPFARTVPASGEEATLRHALESRRDAFGMQVASARTADAALSELRHAVTEAEKELQHARQHAAELPAPGPGHPGDPAAAASLTLEWTSLAVARPRVGELAAVETAANATENARLAASQDATRAADGDAVALAARLAAAPGLFAGLDDLRAARLPEDTAAGIDAARRALAAEETGLAAQRTQLDAQTAGLRARHAPEGDAVETAAAGRVACKARNDDFAAQCVRLEEDIRRDEANRVAREQRAAAIQQALGQLQYWRRLRELIGSHDGRKFRRFAQGLSLDLLVRHANRQLARLSDRYRLHRVEGEELNLEIVDHYQAGSARPMASLSGGESFLTSLALAMGLSDLAGRNVRIDSLFVDEGFGTLDADTLDTAVAALESLRTSHKTIGIISHVEMLKERISAQIRLEKLPGGVSTITIVG